MDFEVELTIRKRFTVESLEELKKAVEEYCVRRQQRDPKFILESWKIVKENK